MKKLLVILAFSLSAFGQSNSVYNASTYAYTTQVRVGNASTGSSSVVADPTAFAQGIPFSPYNVNASVTFNRNASNAETVSLSSVANCFQYSVTCTLSGTFTNKHIAGETIQSGTFGLQEALNVAMAHGSGTVLIDPSWQGPSGASVIIAATGNDNVMIQDNRNPSGALFYQWNGSAYAQTGGGGSGSVSGQASGVIPLASGATAIGAQSHLDDGQTSAATITSSEPVITPSINKEIYAPNYANPAAAVAAACATTSREVYFPGGVYPMSSGMQACTGLHLRCASPIPGTATPGAVLQASSGFAGYMFYNAGGTGGSQVQGVSVDDCTFDTTHDTTSLLAAIDINGINWSKFSGNTFISDGNTNPIIIMDGANPNGDYDNDWFGNRLTDSASGSTSVGLYITDSNWASDGGLFCSNENHWFGGTIQHFGTEILADCANNNTFVSVDLEGYTTYGIHLTTLVDEGHTGAGNAAYNHFDHPRLESHNGLGVQIDAGAYLNDFLSPLPGDISPYFVDSNSPAANTCLNCLIGNHRASWFSTNTYEQIGIGDVPTFPDAYSQSGLSTTGELAAGHFVLSSINGGYTAFYSYASSPQTINWPNQSGTVILAGGNVPVTPTGTATSSTNYPSSYLQLQSSYWSQSVTSGTYTSGITATGTIGQTCTLSSFNNGSTATATVALTSTNTIAASTPIVMTSDGTGATAPPTSATAGNGTATCSGTATLTTSLAATDTSTIYSNVGTGTNPLIDLVIEAGGSPGAHNIVLENFNPIISVTSPATSGTNQAPPGVEQYGYLWNGTSSIADEWTIGPVIGTGSNASSIYTFTHVGSTTGAVSVQVPALKIASSTPVTSTSSANSQVVTCVTGGSSTQYCGADGNWHTPAVVTTPSASYAAGDTACAVAADTTVGAVAITAVASTSSTMTYTMASVPHYFYAGQIVSSQGNTTTGYNAAPLTVASTTGTTVTVTSALNPGTGTGGGTLSLYCANQTTNAVIGTPYTFANTYSVAGGTVVAGTTYQIRGQFSSFSSSAAVGVLFQAEYNTTLIWGMNSYITPSNSLVGQPGELSLDLTALSPSLLVTSPVGMSFLSASTWATASSSTVQPVTVTTTSTEPLALRVAFSAATAGNAVTLNSLVERP